jgi:large subunit ribosomal protein L18
MNHEKSILLQRTRRKYRVRKAIRGTSERPRLSVFRSHQHIYAQLIDDDGQRTLAAASTREAALHEAAKYGGNKTAAQVIGKTIAERALQAGITKVAFDRREYQYHGRVAALADAARAAGLNF